MQLRHRLFTALGIAALAVSSCSSDESTSATTAASDTTASGATSPDTAAPDTTVSTEGVTLRLAIGKENAMIMMRDVAGQFTDTPYDIEWVEFDSSTAMLEALAAGAVDMIPQVQSPAVVTAQGNADTAWTSESAPFSVVAAWTNPDNPGFALVVRDPAVTTAAQLSGGKVAYSRGSLGQFFWSSLVDEQGITDVEQVTLPAPEGRTAFLAGEVDAIVTGNRTAITLQSKGAGTIIDSSSRVVDYYLLSLAAPAALADPATAAAIADVLQRTAASATWALDHLDVVAQYLVDNYSMTAVDAAIEAPFEPTPRAPLDEATLATLQQLVTLFHTDGLIAIDVDPSIIVDTRFDSGVVRPS